MTKIDNHSASNIEIFHLSFLFTSKICIKIFHNGKNKYLESVKLMVIHLNLIGSRMRWSSFKLWYWFSVMLLLPIVVVCSSSFVYVLIKFSAISHLCPLLFKLETLHEFVFFCKNFQPLQSYYIVLLVTFILTTATGGNRS